jgi:hypothetical protein
VIAVLKPARYGAVARVFSKARHRIPRESSPSIKRIYRTGVTAYSVAAPDRANNRH